MTQTNDEMLYEVRNGIGYLTFNRPQARNAFTFAMYERLAEVCEAADRDASVKVLVLSGAGGKAFAAGTDISQFRAFETAEDALAYEARIERVLDALEGCRKPTIAAISGACTGGGAGIAGCCDLRIGSSSAKFGLPIARTLGNCLSMANYARFADLIGTARLKDIVFTSRLIEAEEAKAIGLVSELMPDFESLMARATALAEMVAGHAPLTMLATKRALRALRPAVPRREGDELVVMCYTSQDFREGMDAFLNKRSPRFSGR